MEVRKEPVALKSFDEWRKTEKGTPLWRCALAIDVAAHLTLHPRMCTGPVLGCTQKYEADALGIMYVQTSWRPWTVTCSNMRSVVLADLNYCSPRQRHSVRHLQPPACAISHGLSRVMVSPGLQQHV